MFQLKKNFLSSPAFLVSDPKKRPCSRMFYLEEPARLKSKKTPLAPFIAERLAEKETKRRQERNLESEMPIKAITTILESAEQASALLENLEAISENYRR